MTKIILREQVTNLGSRWRKIDQDALQFRRESVHSLNEQMNEPRELSSGQLKHPQTNK